MSELQRASDAIAAILPATLGHTLDVRFVSEKQPDLALLTDAQLTMLSALMAIARGEKPQKVERKHSGRWHDARQLVHVLDAARSIAGQHNPVLHQSNSATARVQPADPVLIL
jgi:hypothetical protein